MIPLWSESLCKLRCLSLKAVERLPALLAASSCGCNSARANIRPGGVACRLHSAALIGAVQMQAASPIGAAALTGSLGALVAVAGGRQGDPLGVAIAGDDRLEGAAVSR